MRIVLIFKFGRRRINSYAASERDKQKHLHKEEEGSGDEGLPEADSLSDTSQESENPGM
jgi:hypothetical protein